MDDATGDKWSSRNSSGDAILNFFRVARSALGTYDFPLLLLIGGARPELVFLLGQLRNSLWRKIQLGDELFSNWEMMIEGEMETEKDF